MKIALIGSTGKAGGEILKEALDRGHEVVAIARNVSEVEDINEKLQVIQGDIFKLETIENKLHGVDILISAFGPEQGNEDAIIEATNNIISLVKKSEIDRLISIGGAGSLKVKGDIKLVDTDGFLEAWKPIALAHSKALEVYKMEDEINWTYLSPAALLEHGIRTGKYTIGQEYLVVDEKGDSKISYEDLAMAILDEVETPQYIKKRFTVAYNE